MKRIIPFLGVLSVFLSVGCQTYKITEPKSTESGLIYGRLELKGHPFPKTPSVRIMFIPREVGVEREFTDEAVADLAMGKKFKASLAAVESTTSDTRGLIKVDSDGYFACQIPTPGEYYLFRYEATYTYDSSKFVEHNTAQSIEASSLFGYPEESAGLIVRPGEMTYFGALEVYIRETEKSNIIVRDFEIGFLPHSDSNREDALDAAEEIITGYGWDAWIERERETLR